MALDIMGIFHHMGGKMPYLTVRIFKQPIVGNLKLIAYLKATSLLVNIEI